MVSTSVATTAFQSRRFPSVASFSSFRSFSSFKTDYEGAEAERAAQGVVAKPLDAENTARLVELIKNPPKGEEEFLLNLLANAVPPGVDEAAYVKAAFLAASNNFAHIYSFVVRAVFSLVLVAPV